MESKINVTIFSDMVEKEESLTADVDRVLPVSVISKGLAEKLGAQLAASTQAPVKNSEGKLFSPVNQTMLLWHRKDVPKTNTQSFQVVDVAGNFVVFGADAQSCKVSSPIHTLGLKPQNEGWFPSQVKDQQLIALMLQEEKRRQESRKRAEQVKRAEEKKAQEEREKQKQEQRLSKT